MLEHSNHEKNIVTLYIFLTSVRDVKQSKK